MGIQDRDYFGEKRRDEAPFSFSAAKKRTLKDWLHMGLFWMGLLLLLVVVAKQLLPKLRPPSGRLEVQPLAAAPQAPPPQELTPQPNLQQPMPARPVGGYSDAQRPASAEPQAQPVPAAPSTTTLYFCKAYSGGLFWSSAHCNTQQALIERTASVPASLPFDQQVQLADAQRREAASLYHQQPAPAVQTANRCGALRAERESIDARYANWKWQPPEVINPDQIRMRALREEQARLGCAER